MKFKVKSQLDHVEKGGILDDCGPSSTAAAVAWASKYVVDPSAGDGIKAKAKATGFVEKEGVSDNGSSLGDLIKTAKELGAKARYAKSWDDVVLSAHRGAGLLVWVQHCRPERGMHGSAPQDSGSGPWPSGPFRTGESITRGQAEEALPRTRPACEDPNPVWECTSSSLGENALET